MQAPHRLRLPPQHLLACPGCGADCDAGLDPAAQACSACGLSFFDLSGMPCWFDTGSAQKRLWQSLYGMTLQSAEHNLARQQAADFRDLPPRIQARIQTLHSTNHAIVEAVDTLLGGIGLAPVIDPEFSQYDPSRMLQYFELLLRDWAWDGGHPLAESENQRELLRLRAAWEASAPSSVTSEGSKPLGHTAILGAGAGRLSWDIHRQLGASTTIALDTNPVLLSAAQRLLVLQQTWQLPELHANPQFGLPRATTWSITPPVRTEAELDGWFPMGGNAWRPPFKPGRFDTLITPWFIDVNGKDVRQLIAQVQHYLKPGGLWLNTGPLLYSPDIPDAFRYSHEDILDLLALAGFTVHHSACVTSPYLHSPLAAELRIDQIWTFAARAPLSPPLCEARVWDASAPPPWITHTYLPIPKNQPLNTQGNPLLERLAQQVDGQRSLNGIAELLRPNLSPDKDALALVKDAFLTYLLAP